MERPGALHMSMVANYNRDSKKQSKPYSMEDFFLFQPRQDQNLPAGRYGAAAMALISARQFPAWALFCYKELSSAGDQTPPVLLAFQSENAVLLAPMAVPGGFKGMLIAQEEAGEQWVKMTSPCGREVELFVPYIETKVVAKEDVILNLR